MRAVVLSADVGGRAALVRALEAAGCAVVGEGRTAEDGRRLAPACDVLLVDEGALAVALQGHVRRPVVRLAPLVRPEVAAPGASAPDAGTDEGLTIAWPAPVEVLAADLDRLRALLATADGRTPMSEPPGGPPSSRSAVKAAATDATRAGPRPRIVAIGASAGGPAAVARLLAALGPLPVPVVIGQHLHPDFAASLRTTLTRTSGLQVVMGAPGLDLGAGAVVLAGPGGNLVVTADGRCAVHPTRGLQVPDIDVLLHSVADAYGAAAVGVILTGMGRDGAAGLRAMRDRGALTIAQDRGTSTVFGMPAAAAGSGAASRILPLDAIGPAILTALAAPRVDPRVRP